MKSFLVAVLASVSMLACVPADAPRFNATDITGADYGAALDLTDHHGQRRTLGDFQGKVVTLFFGFTQCPDVCPTSLLTMSEVMRLLGDDANKIQVLFATVDPERDTAELLASYVPAFDERFLGLYGTPEEIATVAKAFKVFYRKSGDTSGMDYTIDHSAGTYVFDPAGRLRLYVKHAESADRIAADIRLLLQGK